MTFLTTASRAVLFLAAFSVSMAAAGSLNDAAAQSVRTPALTVTNDPLPADLQSRLYSKPTRVPDITMERVLGSDYFEGGQTVVGRKVESLRKELSALQSNVSQLSDRLVAAQNNGQAQAAEYYANVATISTQLQAGTTPGNPRLIKRLSIARNSLESLAGSVASLNDLAMEISGAASMAGFLLESVRTTYTLSGAVEEDHVNLAQLEDSINAMSVAIERLQNNVNDDITRTVSYLSTERNNLRTLALAITTGDMIGKNLSNRPFSSAQPANFTNQGGVVQAAPGTVAPRPLVKIRFDRANVAYEQPVYMAVNEALQRYPNARFELVAVHPAGVNTAEGAIESTRARRNAEKVLRSLTQMGLTMDRIDMSYMPSNEATSSEVHLYVR
jgi:hypothetical protein